MVNRVEKILPMGMTAGNVLDRYGWRPPSTRLQMNGLGLRRALGTSVFDPSPVYETGVSYLVRLAWFMARGSIRFSLPLLHGDVLTISG